MPRFFRFLGLLAILWCPLGLTGCSLSGGLPAGVESMEKLKAENKCPVEIVGASAQSGVGNVATNTNPTVTLELKNLSDKKITLIKWVVVNVNKDGKLCKNEQDEGGYAEVGGLAPGESVEGKSFSSDPETVKVVVLIKDLVYETKQSNFDIAMKWVNNNFEAELQKASNPFSKKSWLAYFR